MSENDKYWPFVVPGFDELTPEMQLFIKKNMASLAQAAREWSREAGSASSKFPNANTPKSSSKIKDGEAHHLGMVAGGHAYTLVGNDAWSGVLGDSRHVVGKLRLSDIQKREEVVVGSHLSEHEAKDDPFVDRRLVLGSAYKETSGCHFERVKGGVFEVYGPEPLPANKAGEEENDKDLPPQINLAKSLKVHGNAEGLIEGSSVNWVQDNDVWFIGKAENIPKDSQVNEKITSEEVIYGSTIETVWGHSIERIKGKVWSVVGKGVGLPFDEQDIEFKKLGAGNQKISGLPTSQFTTMSKNVSTAKKGIDIAFTAAGKIYKSPFSSVVSLIGPVLGLSTSSKTPDPVVTELIGGDIQTTVIGSEFLTVTGHSTSTVIAGEDTTVMGIVNDTKMGMVSDTVMGMSNGTVLGLAMDMALLSMPTALLEISSTIFESHSVNVDLHLKSLEIHSPGSGAPKAATQAADAQKAVTEAESALKTAVSDTAAIEAAGKDAEAAASATNEAKSAVDAAKDALTSAEKAAEEANDALAFSELAESGVDSTEAAQTASDAAQSVKDATTSLESAEDALKSAKSTEEAAQAAKTAKEAEYLKNAENLVNTLDEAENAKAVLDLKAVKAAEAAARIKKIEGFLGPLFKGVDIGSVLEKFNIVETAGKSAEEIAATRKYIDTIYKVLSTVVGSGIKVGYLSSVVHTSTTTQPTTNDDSKTAPIDPFSENENNTPNILWQKNDEIDNKNATNPEDDGLKDEAVSQFKENYQAMNPYQQQEFSERLASALHGKTEETGLSKAELAHRIHVNLSGATRA